MKASRWALVTVAAAGAAGAAYVLQLDRGTMSASRATRNPAHVARAPGSLPRALDQLDRPPLSSRVQQDPFTTSPTQPESQPAPVAIAPAPPVFPYKYAGTLKNVNGVTESFLLRGNELVPIKAGQLLEETWRIEALTKDRIEVTYVPAGERVSMLLADLVNIPVAQSATTTAVAAPAALAGVGPSPIPAGASAMPNANISGGVAATQAAPRAAAASPNTAAAGATSAAVGSQAPAQGPIPLGPSPIRSFSIDVPPTGKVGR
jgi:hypothetical protein